MRTPRSVAARNTARAALVVQLQAAKAFVQQTADADPEKAVEIITSAGLVTRKPTTRRKAPFAVKQGATSGTVQLVTKSAGARASYEWEWSSDGGKTWIALPITCRRRPRSQALPRAQSDSFAFAPSRGRGKATGVSRCPSS